MVEVEVNGSRYVLPVSRSELEELKQLVESKGGSIRPYIPSGWHSLDSLKKVLR